MTKLAASPNAIKASRPTVIRTVRDRIVEVMPEYHNLGRGRRREPRRRSDRRVRHEDADARRPPWPASRDRGRLPIRSLGDARGRGEPDVRLRLDVRPAVYAYAYDAVSAAPSCNALDAAPRQR